MRFAPGQFVKLRVAEFEWRDYSIAAAAGAKLTLLVSNRTHGDGSSFADAAEPGAETDIEGPFGGYHLQPNRRRKVFVATGTGVAPFLPMFDAMARSGELDRAELYFGCRTSAEDITTAFVSRPKRTVTCLSREPAKPGGFAAASHTPSPGSPSIRPARSSMFAVPPLWSPTAGQFWSAPARSRS